MQDRQQKRFKHRTLTLTLAALGAGLLAGMIISDGQARTEPPTEHKGVSVASLGVLSETSIKRQIGLEGYVLQLREITLAPGGQIAKHSHAGRPGLAWTLSGSWIEGRPDGDREYPAGEMTAIIEDADTVHWFFNNEAEPVKVLVCDLVPAS